MQAGWALYFGRGTSKNFAAARQYLEAARTIPYANYLLAWLYWNGEGVERNPAMAEQYAKSAIEGGEDSAVELYDFMKPVLAALRAGNALT